jgi:hypothetical protein
LQAHHQVLNVTVPAHGDWLLLCRVLLAENPTERQDTCTVSCSSFLPAMANNITQYMPNAGINYCVALQMLN